MANDRWIFTRTPVGRCVVREENDSWAYLRGSPEADDAILTRA